MNGWCVQYDGLLRDVLEVEGRVFYCCVKEQEVSGSVV